MGSLTSTPKAAKTVSQQPVPTSNNGGDSSSPQDMQGDEQVRKEKARERKKTLLARDRSRRGTVNTTLHGVLSSINGGAFSRKTLLGE